MDDATYTQRVLARCSNEFHGDLVDREDVDDIIDNLIEYGNYLDQVKKALFYGKEPTDDFFTLAAVEKPISDAYTTQERTIIHSVIGVVTEGIEMLEAIRGMFRNKNNAIDTINLQEEFGDLQWYRTLGLSAIGQTHVENIIQNDAKLEKRFGSTFSEDAANNRDLDAERSTLEGP